MTRLRNLSRRLDGRGFTLVELLIVILVVGILAAIALPSFLNQTDKAADSGVQQTLSVSRKAAKAVYVSNEGRYPAADRLIAELRRGEPGFTYGNRADGELATTTRISVDRESATEVSMCQAAASDRVLCLLIDENGGVPTLLTASSRPLLDRLLGVEDAHAAADDVRWSMGATEQDARAALRDLDGDGHADAGPGGSGRTMRVGARAADNGGSPDPDDPQPTRSYAQEVAADDPEAHWSLDEPAGSAQAAGSPGPAMINRVGGSWTFGEAGAFPGSGSSARAQQTFMTTASQVHNNTSEWTLEAWYLPSLDWAGSIVWNGAGGAIAQAAGGQLIFNQGGTIHWSSYVFPNRTDWVHVAATCKDSTLRFYANGQPVGTAPCLAYNGGYGTGLMDTANGFSGGIDEPAVYDHALSADRILAHYQAAQR